MISITGGHLDVQLYSRALQNTGLELQLQQLKNVYMLTSLCEYMYCGLYICMLPGFFIQKCVYNHQETGCNAEMFRYIYMDSTQDIYAAMSVTIH